MKTVNLYTDGGCSGNQNDTNLGGWGAVLEYQGNVKELYGSERNTTNNRMEMMALIEGLKAMKQRDIAVNVYSDSSYLMDCFRKKWYVAWEQNGWKNASKKPVENQDLWKELLALVRSFGQVNFYRIKGHLDARKVAEMKKWYEKFEEWNYNADFDHFKSVVHFNNEADRLANKGIDEIR